MPRQVGERYACEKCGAQLRVSAERFGVLVKR